MYVIIIMENISEESKIKIVKTLIEPSYNESISENLILMKHFRRAGTIFETLSKIFVGAGSVLSFSAGVWDDKILSFVSGTVSVLGIVFMQFSGSAYKESEKNNTELNTILSSLNIKPVADELATTRDLDDDKKQTVDV